MFDKLWKILAGAAGIGLVVGLVLYFTGETRREMTPLMSQMASAVTVRFAHELPRHPEVNTVLVLVVGRGNRDEEQQFHEMLLERVRDADKYRLITWAEVQERLEKGNWYEKFLGKSGLVPGSPPTTVEQALPSIEYLEHANILIDGILLIRVTSFNEGPEQTGLGAKIAVEADLYSAKQKEVVEQLGPFTESLESPWDMRYLRYSMGSQSLLWRVPVWFLAAVSLPWLGIQLVRAVVRRRSNEANLVMLVGLTAFDLLLAWVLLFAFGWGPGTFAGLLVLAGLMGYYNYDATDYIARKLL